MCSGLPNTNRIKIDHLHNPCAFDRDPMQQTSRACDSPQEWLPASDGMLGGSRSRRGFWQQPTENSVDLQKQVLPSIFQSKKYFTKPRLSLSLCVPLSVSLSLSLPLSPSLQVTRGSCLSVEGTNLDQEECVRYDCQDTQGSCPPEGYEICDG